MTEQGDVIENPRSRERIVFRETGADTGGELLRFDLTMAPGGSLPMAHVHPRQEERFIVVSGRVRFRIGGEERVAGVGETVVAPPGTAHTFQNDGDEEARLTIEFRPALKTETLLRTVFGLAKDGKSNERGMPGFLQSALLAREYDTFLPGLPIWLQKAGLLALAPMARALGYRARYEEYGGPD